MYALSLLFGVTSSVISLFLKFGHRLLMRVLKSESSARVQMSSIEEVEEFKAIISYRYLNLGHV
jgi:hypothetical protein